jgi:hypothetical protein
MAVDMRFAVMVKYIRVVMNIMSYFPLTSRSARYDIMTRAS